MHSLFLSTFVLIFIAELPDKTAFATLILATRGNPRAIFLGVCAAFLVQCAVAVLFGTFLGSLASAWMSDDVKKWTHVGAGLLFLVFAVLAWKRRDEESEIEDESATKNASGTFWKSVTHSFIVIFIAEWGDLTQLASASLAARYHEPWTIFSASVLSLWAVTAIAVVAGSKLSKAINPKTLNRVAAAAFAFVGVYLIAKEALP
jgi:putative Ca2+/H+ antiporter (TMEM165/GDT1 family)